MPVQSQPRNPDGSFVPITWAEDNPNPPETVEPSAGRKGTGYLAADVMTQGELNWQSQLPYRAIRALQRGSLATQEKLLATWLALGGEWKNAAGVLEVFLTDSAGINTVVADVWVYAPSVDPLDTDTGATRLSVSVTQGTPLVLTASRENWISVPNAYLLPVANAGTVFIPDLDIQVTALGDFDAPTPPDGYALIWRITTDAVALTDQEVLIPTVPIFQAVGIQTLSAVDVEVGCNLTLSDPACGLTVAGFATVGGVVTLGSTLVSENESALFSDGLQAGTGTPAAFTTLAEPYAFDPGSSLTIERSGGPPEVVDLDPATPVTTAALLAAAFVADLSAPVKVTDNGADVTVETYEVGDVLAVLDITAAAGNALAVLGLAISVIKGTATALLEVDPTAALIRVTGLGIESAGGAEFGGPLTIAAGQLSDLKGPVTLGTGGGDAVTVNGIATMNAIVNLLAGANLAGQTIAGTAGSLVDVERALVTDLEFDDAAAALPASNRRLRFNETTLTVRGADGTVRALSVPDRGYQALFTTPNAIATSAAQCGRRIQETEPVWLRVTFDYLHTSGLAGQLNTRIEVAGPATIDISVRTYTLDAAPGPDDRPLSQIFRWQPDDDFVAPGTFNYTFTVRVGSNLGPDLEIRDVGIEVVSTLEV